MDSIDIIDNERLSILKQSFTLSTTHKSSANLNCRNSILSNSSIQKGNESPAVTKKVCFNEDTIEKKWKDDITQIIDIRGKRTKSIKILLKYTMENNNCELKCINIEAGDSKIKISEETSTNICKSIESYLDSEYIMPSLCTLYESTANIKNRKWLARILESTSIQIDYGPTELSIYETKILKSIIHVPAMKFECSDDKINFMGVSLYPKPFGIKSLIDKFHAAAASWKVQAFSSKLSNYISTYQNIKIPKQENKKKAIKKVTFKDDLLHSSGNKSRLPKDASAIVYTKEEPNTPSISVFTPPSNKSFEPIRSDQSKFANTSIEHKLSLSSITKPRYSNSSFIEAKGLRMKGSNNSIRLSTSSSKLADIVYENEKMAEDANQRTLEILAKYKRRHKKRMVLFTNDSSKKSQKPN